MSELGIPEIEELIGAYALDAVDDDEREAVERHLAVCPRCRAELADHLEVAAMLAYEGAPAPDDVWERIESSLEEEPPELRLPVSEGVPVVSLDERRSRRQRRVLAAVAGVAAAVALILGIVVVRDQADQPSRDLAELAQDALAAPGSTQAVLRPPGGQPGPEAVAVVTSEGRGFVRAVDLPELPADRTYQLWGVVDDQAISLGVLGPNPDVAAFQVDDADRVAAYAITDEVAGGVIASQNQPVVVGEKA
jgi:anti-sigma factor RsiW